MPSPSSGSNLIDGRFIDKRTGVFVDICVFSLGLGAREIMSTAPLFVEDIPLYYERQTFYDYIDKANCLVPQSMLLPLIATSWMDGIATWVPRDTAKRLSSRYGEKSLTVYGERKRWYNQWIMKEDYDRLNAKKQKRLSFASSPSSGAGSVLPPSLSAGTSVVSTPAPPPSLPGSFSASFSPHMRNNASTLTDFVFQFSHVSQPHQTSVMQ